MEQRIVISNSKRAKRQCLACGCLYEDPKAKFCIFCMRSGTMGPAVQRPANAILPTPRAVTARELLRTQHATISSSAYPTLRFAPNSFICLFAPPGQGKTLFALLTGNSLRPCVYLPLEEKIGPSLASKLAFLELHSEDLSFHEPNDVSEISALAAHPGLRSMVIDSLNLTVLQASDVLRLCRANNIVIIGILQCTKSGQARGSLEFPHLADVVIKVENLQWKIEKSRFQQAGVGGPVI